MAHPNHNPAGNDSFLHSRCGGAASQSSHEASLSFSLDQCNMVVCKYQRGGRRETWTIIFFLGLAFTSLALSVWYLQTAQPQPSSKKKTSKNEQLKQVFVTFLNRNKDIDRRNYITRQLTVLGLNYSRFPSIEIGNQGSDDILTRTMKACEGRRRSIGELGCTLSHLSVLQKLAVEVDPRHYPIALIMEDDANLSPLRTWPLVVEVATASAGTVQHPVSTSGTTMNSLLLGWLRAVVPRRWNIINMSPIRRKVFDVPPLFVPWLPHHYGTVGYIVNMEGDWLPKFREIDWASLLGSKSVCRVADELVYELLGGSTNESWQAFSSNIPWVLHGKLENRSNSTIRKGEAPFVLAARRSQVESWQRLFAAWLGTPGTDR